MVIGLRSGVPSIVDGVISGNSQDIYGFRGYLKCLEPTGSGTAFNPSYGYNSSNGTGTRAFKYRGYLISYRFLGSSPTYELPALGSLSEWDSIFTNGSYQNMVTDNNAPSASRILSQATFIHLRGSNIDQVISCEIASIGGSFLGDGIDDIISQNLLALPITVIGYQTR